MVETCHAVDGGCWICGTDAETNWAFSHEFDTFYHPLCAEAEGVIDGEHNDPILNYELQRFDDADDGDNGDAPEQEETVTVEEEADRLVAEMDSQIEQYHEWQLDSDD